MARLLAALLLSLLAPTLAPTAATAQAPRPGPTVRTVTGPSDTIVNTDCGNVVQFNRGSAIAVTLPQAASGGNFNPRCQIGFVNIGAGNATITPTSSQIDGRASIVLQQGGGLSVISSGGQWVSGGIFPALSTSGLVDPDQLPIATASITGAIRIGTCLEGTGTGNKTLGITANCRRIQFQWNLDGGGSAIADTLCSYSAGQLCLARSPSACTIAGISVYGDQASGNATVRLASTTHASFAPGTHPVAGDQIDGSGLSISSAAKGQDTTLTSWSTSVAAGAILAIKVSSVTNHTRLWVTVDCDRT